jgi:hypothetical protein
MAMKPGAHPNSRSTERGSNLYLEKIAAGSRYPGFFSDLESTRGSLSAPLFGRLKIQTSASLDRSVLQVTPLDRLAPRLQRYSLGMLYGFSFGTDARFGYEIQRRKDIAGTPDFEDISEGPYLGLSHGFNKISLRASTRLLRIKDKVQNNASTKAAFRFDTYYQPTSRQRYSIFFSQGQDGLTASPDLEKTIGANIGFEPRQNIKTDFRYERTGLGKGNREEDQWLANISYQMKGGHSLKLEARHRIFAEINAETSILMSYAIPFGIPTGLKDDIGVVTGRVFAADEPDKGYSDILLSIGGATAVTDGNGKFIFPALKTGTYYIWMDTSSLGFGRVTVQKTPIPVQIAGASKQNIQIAVTKASVLKVKAIKYKPAKGAAILQGNAKGEIKEDGPVGNMSITLRRDDQIIRRRTNSEGLVTFRNLRPGKWQVQATPHKTTRLQYLEKSEWEIEFQSGGEEELLVKVLPKFRKLMMLDDEEEEEEN